MSSRTRRQNPLTAWQKAGLKDLRAVAAQLPNELRIIGRSTHGDEGAVVVKLRLSTSGLEFAEGGLPLREQEEFVLSIPQSLLDPPSIEVEHRRFVGYPHVLQGHRLCLYLDPSREWDPATGGIRSTLNQLWTWLSDAAGNKFDAKTAMYHAVGGVLHQTPGAPTLVIREPLPSQQWQTGYLTQRSVHRLDLTFARPQSEALRVPVITAPSPLFLGAGQTLAQLLNLLDNPRLDRPEGRAAQGHPVSKAVLTTLAASSAKNPHDSAQYLVLAVPHPTGGPPHLLAARIPGGIANAWREVIQGQGAALSARAERINPNLVIEWCRVSDERQAVTTRRDNSRPISNFLGKRIQVWGCGGIGSWVAEFLARAGAAQITVCDPGIVSGGLLVRQNYIEADIGDNKAASVARRLQEISDRVDIEVAEGRVPARELSELLSSTDLIIDATVSIAVGRFLNATANTVERTATLAQVATDVRTGSLGVLTVSASGERSGPMSIDEQSGATVLADPALEVFHCLWQDALDGDEITPTRGCSAPTFHGSSADLAAVAASLINFLGLHLSSQISGTHLIALPHAEGGPRHHFVPYRG